MTLALIVSIFKSLELFLALKNKLFYYEIIQKSKEKQQSLIKEIEVLRAKGDSDSADYADRLRQELLEEKRELICLEEFYSSSSKKS